MGKLNVHYNYTDYVQQKMQEKQEHNMNMKNINEKKRLKSYNKIKKGEKQKNQSKRMGNSEARLINGWAKPNLDMAVKTSKRIKHLEAKEDHMNKGNQ